MTGAALILKAIEAVALSQDNIRQQLRTGLQSYNAGKPYDQTCYLVDVFGDAETGDMVYQCGDGLFMCAYEITADGESRGTVIHMSAATPVMPRTVYDVADGTTVLERKITKAERDGANATDYAGKNKSFPIMKTGDVQAAVKSIGRAGADNYAEAQLKANIIRIAKRKGYESELPKEWTKEAAHPGAVVEAEIELPFEPLTEVREGSVGVDGTLMLKLIAPGWGSSGYYSSAVLEAAGTDKVFPKGTKMYWNHATPTEEAERPEGDLRDLASVLTEDAKWEAKGPKGPGLYARAKAFENFRQPIDDLAKDIGVSIRAMGVSKPGKVGDRTGNVIEKLSRGISVDYVTTPGAGGKILQLFEAARSANIPIGEADTMTPEQQKALEDSNKALLTESSNTKVEVRRMKERLAISDARVLCISLVGSEKLHEATKSRLIAELPLRAPLTEAGDLDTVKMTELVKGEVKREADYLHAVTGGARVEGMGATVPVEEAEAKPEEVLKEMTESAMRMGLSKEAAAIYAAGRV